MKGRLQSCCITVLGFSLLFIIVWEYCVPGAKVENTHVNKVLRVHKVMQNSHKELDVSTSSSEILTSSSEYYETLLDHDFPHCRQRNIYNGNAKYSLSDILELVRKFIPPPTDFVQRLKNPCWYANYDKVESMVHWKTNYTKKSEIKFVASLPNSSNSSKLYCLPYMYLLGYPKCGTTSLSRYLRYHPEYANISPRGYGWLGLRNSGLTDNYPNNFKSVLGLLERFYLASQQIEESSSQEHMDDMIFADFSPATSWRQEGFEQSGGSMCDPPLLLRELQPDAKFVVLLREPISRLYSAFWFYANRTLLKKMKSRNGSNIFAEDVHTYFDQLKQCDKRKSMLECLREAGDFNHHFQRKEQLLTGFYYLYLLPWLQIFPRESFLFIRTEDMKEDTGGVLQEVFQFLGMSHLPEKRLSAIVKKIFNSQALLHSNNSNVLLPSSTQEQLRTYFRPFNAKLAGLLNDDKFLWNDIN